MVTPPPSTDPGLVFPICPGSGGGGRAPLQNSSSFQNPKIQKSQPKFRIFGNSRNLLKIQKNPKFLEFPKIQKSKNPNPSFGFLETRGICSKSKKPKIPRVSKNSSSFQKFLDFWKLEEFWVFWILSLGWDFWIFGFLETQVLVRFF